MHLSFESVAEDQPGERWQRLFRTRWPHYRKWYLGGNGEERPTYLACERALREHVPELVWTWERLVELAGGSDVQARLLSSWCPPGFVVGCSQAVRVAGEPILVRNYDYEPRLCDGLFLSTAWNGRRVMAASDCLIGALDGVNDAGLCVSLSFGGRRDVAPGFGAPLVLRYVLEFCRTTKEATGVLERVPLHQAYSVTVLDAEGDHVTVFAGPPGPTRVTRDAVATNHQGEVTWRAHAEATGSVERERHLLALLERADLTNEGLVAAFLAEPLRSSAFDRGFGTLYTAAYRPAARSATYSWPGVSWTQTTEAFVEGSLRVRVDGRSGVEAG